MYAPLGTTTIAYTLILAFAVHVADVDAGGCIHDLDLGRVHGVGANITFSCDFNSVMAYGFCRDTRIVIVEKNSERVPADMLEAVNRTLTMTIRNATEQKLTYRCMCGERAVDETCIRVTSAPMAVAKEDFVCVSYDFECMQCTFPNVEPVTMNSYSLTYQNNRQDMPTTSLACEKRQDFVVCTTRPDLYQERRTSEHFTFHLTIENGVGAVHQKFAINNLESVVPARPDIDCSRQAGGTTNSFCFTWFSKKRTLYAGKGLVWQANVSALNLSAEEWPLDNYNTTYCLKNLPYAGYEYQLVLRLRVNAVNSRWSEPFICKFKTADYHPAEPLPAIPGGFYLYPSHEKFRVYWQDLPRDKHNGWNFSYEITEYRINKILTNISLVKIEGNSAIVKGWQWNSTYEFVIRSRNGNYDSIRNSSLRIRACYSSEQQIALSPNHLQYKNDIEKEIFQLSWEPPQEAAAVQSYTVFWCRSKTLSECSGAIQYVTLPGNATRYAVNQTEDEPLTMAVSANYQYYNSTMLWPPCLRDTKNGIEVIKLGFDKRTNSTLSFSWRMHCNSLVTGFNLTYCETNNTGSVFNCRTKLVHKSARSYTVDDLKANTNYRANIFMLAERQNGKESIDLYVKTEEGVPLSPRDLSYNQLTSSSVTLRWLPPQQSNGRIRGYLISVRDNSTYNEEYNLTVAENSPSLEYVLCELKAYTTYNVAVRAYTIYNSEFSNVLQLTTDVSVPSEPVLHQRTDSTYSYIILEWMQPKEPAGHLDFYEIEISECDHNGRVLRSQISYVMGAQPLACQQQVPDCKSGHHYIYNVRAVNVGQMYGQQGGQVHNHSVAKSTADAMQSTDDELLCSAADRMSDEQHNLLKDYLNSPQKYRLHQSVWSSQTLQCSDAISSNLALIIVSIVGIVLLVAYFLHIEIKRMSNLKCILPVGLTIKDLGTATIIGIMPRPDYGNLGDHLAVLSDADAAMYTAMQPKRTQRAAQTADPSVGYVEPDPSSLQCIGTTAGGYVKPDSTSNPHDDIPETAKLFC